MSFEIALKSLPIFYAFTIAINFFSVFYKGSHGIFSCNLHKKRFYRENACYSDYVSSRLCSWRLLSPLVHAICAAFFPSRQTNLQGTFSAVKAVDSFFYEPMILRLNGFIYEMNVYYC